MSSDDALPVYEPGTEFATLSGSGSVRIYRVNHDGEPLIDLVRSLSWRPPSVTDVDKIDAWPPPGRDTTQR